MEVRHSGQEGIAFAKNDPNSNATEFSVESDFYKSDPLSETPIIFLNFPNMKCDGIFINDKIKNVIPIAMEQSIKAYKLDDVNYYRWMYPLVPATAITTHKSQSFTARDGVVYQPS